MEPKKDSDPSSGLLTSPPPSYEDTFPTQPIPQTLPDNSYQPTSSDPTPGAHPQACSPATYPLTGAQPINTVPPGQAPYPTQSHTNVEPPQPYTPAVPHSTPVVLTQPQQQSQVSYSVGPYSQQPAVAISHPSGSAASSQVQYVVPYHLRNKINEFSPSKNYRTLALIALILCCPIGIAAFFHSKKVDEKNEKRDFVAASIRSRAARQTSIIAIGFAAMYLLPLFVVLVIL